MRHRRSSASVSSPRSPDQELIHRAHEGDVGAFQALVDRNMGLFRERIRQRLGPAVRRKVAESDIIQEDTLVALRRLDDFEDRGKGSFGAWMARIVELKTREIVRQYAATGKRDVMAEVSRSARAETANVPGHAASPSQVAMAGELRERAARALDELPDDYREVFLLVQQEGLTMKEVSRRMGRSEAAVRQLYGRALSRFAKLLDLPYGRAT